MSTERETDAEFWHDDFISPNHPIVRAEREANLGSPARLSVLSNEHIPTNEHLERFTQQCREMFAQAKQDDRDAQFVLRLVTDRDFRARMITELRTRRLISPETERTLLAADNEGPTS